MKNKKITSIPKYFIHLAMILILITVFLTVDSSSSLLINQKIVYDGMTIVELTNKLNRVLKSDLTNYGYTYASKSLEYGVDPYVAVSITLLESGCGNGSCSSLTKYCHNVGGMKGSPGCNGGSFASFSTMDEGIERFIANLAKNYYAYGLDTPEKMNHKYAESTDWARKVNNYIEKIKNA